MIGTTAYAAACAFFLIGGVARLAEGQIKTGVVGILLSAVNAIVLL